MAETFTQTTALQFGASALQTALAAMGLSVSEQAFFWLLGQAYGESGLGLGDMAHMPSARSNFLGTNNWGAVYCGATTPKGSVLKAVPDATCVRGAGDTIPGGGKFVPNVTKFATPVDGAKGFAAFVMAIPGVTAVFKNSDATSNDYARALYKAGYFGGFKVGDDGEKSLNQGMVFKSQAETAKKNPKTAGNVLPTQAEADEANIRAYASMVDNMANAARKAVGSNPIPMLVASAPALIPDADSTIGRVAKVGFAAAVVGAAGYVAAVFFAPDVMNPRSAPERAPVRTVKKGTRRRA